MAFCLILRYNLAINNKILLFVTGDFGAASPVVESPVTQYYFKVTAQYKKATQKYSELVDQ